MPEMKNSGIEWIGFIPQSWDVFRFKNIIKDSISGEVIDKGYWNDGSELLYTCQRTPMNSTFDKFPQSKRTTEKDLLLTRNATPYVFIPVPNSIYSNVVQKITLHDGWDKRYIRYAIQLGADEQQVNGDTIPSYNMDVWKNIYICKIPLNLQVRIANLLDQKCSEIDSLSADIQSQIDVLEEYKKSTITEAVTKGLNPDVEMKDSGIEWIGMIPAHWDVDKIKYHLKRNEPRNPGDVQVLSVYREYGVIPKDSRDDNHNVTSEDTSKYKYIKPGDLVINKMKAWQGSLAVSDYEGIVSPAYFVYNFTDELFNKKYFHFLIRSCYKDEFRRISGGIREGQWDLPAESFANELVLLPPIDEQNEIVEFINSKYTEIEEAIDLKKAQLETLVEYKKSLIYEYVTGKKEVPENV